MAIFLLSIIFLRFWFRIFQLHLGLYKALPHPAGFNHLESTGEESVNVKTLYCERVENLIDMLMTQFVW